MYFTRMYLYPLADVVDGSCLPACLAASAKLGRLVIIDQCFKLHFQPHRNSE